MKENETESLIKYEETLLEKGKDILSEFKGFIEDYKKLVKQNEKMIKLSDRQEKMLRILNDKLEVTSITDPMTKVYNKGKLIHYVKSLKENIDNSENEKFFLFFIDLDNFKYYNDSFGHDIGDFILISFVEIVRGTIRNSDFLARFGGDEFVLVITDVTKERCFEIMKLIQGKVESTNGFEKEISEKLNRQIEIVPGKKISFSVGVSEYKKEFNIPNIEKLLSNADKALYQAKNSGKNCCVFYDNLV